jgi:chromosome segregation ATPase
MIAGGIQALNDDAQRLSNESLRLHIDTEEWKRDLTALQLSIEEENAFLNGIKPNQEILNQDVASLKQKVEDMQSISYDGTFIWRITSVKEKLSKFFNA